MTLGSPIDWKSFDTFIFDLDGTLVDSLNQIESALNVTRINFGHGATPRGQIFAKLGLPIRQLFSDLQMSQKTEVEFIAFFRKELANQILTSNQLFPGVIELMLLIRDLGSRIAIATSKPTHLANLVVKNSGISGMIDFVQGTDDFPAKPNPIVIERCISGLNSENAIMIGDRVEDVWAALALYIPAIGIAQSAHSEDMLSKSGAILTFKRIDSLYKYIYQSI